MKVANSILAKFIPSLAGQNLDEKLWSERLPNSGLEVGGVESLGKGLDTVVLAQIESFQKHPDASKLNICQVNTGKETLQIVCGAPNVHKDMFVACALIGSVLPGDFKIKASKIRGVDSFGMLCSGAELGLSADADAEGILDLNQDVKNPGKPLFDIMNWKDQVWDIELTPDRGDCLSHLGLSREFARWESWKLDEPEFDEIWQNQGKETAIIEVDVRAPKDCPYYSVQVFDGFDSIESNPHISNQISKLGIKSHFLPADLTNLVMMEFGQPMHAFDADKIVGSKIVVRMAKEGEKITTLDGVERSLCTEDLVIADLEKPIALAGVMGSEDSAVTKDTKRVALESAAFDPVSIRKTVQRYKVHSDSSHRFERGVDPAVIKKSAGRFSALVSEFAKSKRRGMFVEVGDLEKLSNRPVLNLDLREFKKVVGMDISAEKARDYFLSIGIEAQEKSQNLISVQVPTWRHDLEREVDLIEDLARLSGYDKVPTRFPKMQQEDKGLSSKVYRQITMLRTRAIESGLQEVMPYSFVSKSDLSQIPDFKALPLENALSSEWTHMRPNLSFGLLKTLKNHCANQEYRAQVFDCGQVFEAHDDGSEKSTGALQGIHLGFALMGTRSEIHWSQDKKSEQAKSFFDFYDAKGITESFYDSWSIINGRWKGTQLQPLWHFLEEASDDQKAQASWMPLPLLHPGKSAVLIWPGRGGGTPVGFIGEFMPKLKSELLNLPKGLNLGLVIAEFKLFDDLLKEIENQKNYLDKPLVTPISRTASISKYPEAERDLSMVFPSDLSSEKIERVISKAAAKILVSVKCVDLFKLSETEKSLSYRMKFQAPDRSLKEEEIKSAVDEIVKALEKESGAQIR